MVKLIYSLILSFLLSSCGAYVVVDYDKEKDFSVFQTYDFYPDIESGLSKLDDNRIIKITDSLLQQRGFSRSQSSDFLINFYAEEFMENTRNTIGVGIGQSSRNSHVHISGGIPIGSRVINQYLTVDFVDAKKDQLIWKAESGADYKEHITPEQKEKFFISVLSKILKKFPPE